MCCIDQLNPQPEAAFGAFCDSIRGQKARAASWVDAVNICAPLSWVPPATISHGEAIQGTPQRIYAGLSGKIDGIFQVCSNLTGEANLTGEVDTFGAGQIGKV